MPIYDYRCDVTQKIIEVTHKMSKSIKTWGELCEYANIEMGDTPLNSPVTRIITGGHLNIISVLPKFDASILPK